MFTQGVIIILFPYYIALSIILFVTVFNDYLSLIISVGISVN